MHGDAPRTNLTGYGRDNMEWGKRTIDGIHGLLIEGEYEWWEDRVNPALAFRMMYPKSCVDVYKRQPLRGIEVTYSKNVLVDGITIVNPDHYTVFGGETLSLIHIFALLDRLIDSRNILFIIFVDNIETTCI